jgi:hypothetical protein
MRLAVLSLTDTLRWFLFKVPFANLVYLKCALDYLLFFHMYEMLDAGWRHRTSCRLQKERGRAPLGYALGGYIPRSVPANLFSKWARPELPLLGEK